MDKLRPMTTDKLTIWPLATLSSALTIYIRRLPKSYIGMHKHDKAALAPANTAVKTLNYDVRIQLLSGEPCYWSVDSVDDLDQVTLFRNRIPSF